MKTLDKYRRNIILSITIIVKCQVVPHREKFDSPGLSFSIFPGSIGEENKCLGGSSTPDFQVSDGKWLHDFQCLISSPDFFLKLTPIYSFAKT